MSNSSESDPQKWILFAFFCFRTKKIFRWAIPGWDKHLFLICHNNTPILYVQTLIDINFTRCRIQRIYNFFLPNNLITILYENIIKVVYIFKNNVVVPWCVFKPILPNFIITCINYTPFSITSFFKSTTCHLETPTIFLLWFWSFSYRSNKTLNIDPQKPPGFYNNLN